MSSRTWTPPAVASEASRHAGDAWRAVEAQHVVSTMALVDTLDEQSLLEDLLEASKPARPEAAPELHYLLVTPYRYRPPRGGSRFRGETDPGVFYAADAIRTACAELGYWRWRHLADSPALDAMPARVQTVFRVTLRAPAVDLRQPPFEADRILWTDADDYSACQTFARVAREARIGILRYESVRDPERGGCVAVLDPAAFAQPKPLELQSWTLSVSRERVVWHRSPAVGGGAFEFEASAWRAPVKPTTPGSTRASAPRRRTRKR
jgi:RES domain